MRINSENLRIKDALVAIDEGDFKIPVFQRSYVWTKKQVISLLDSIFHQYPVGSLLFLPETDMFSSKAFEGSPASDEVVAKQLVLDGQQRLTSCYQVFYDKSGSYRYFIDLKKLKEQYDDCDGDLDNVAFADCIVTKSIKNKPVLKINTKDGYLPFSYLRDEEWYQDIVQGYARECEIENGGDETAYSKFLRGRLRKLLDPFFTYDFSVLKLPSDLELPAICRVFETLNSTGTKLDSFDLCVARFMRDNYNLKDKVEEVRTKYPTMAMLFKDDKNREYPLQVIALYVERDHKKNKLAKSLDTSVIKAYWDKAVASLNQALEILDGTGADTTKTLDLIPYPSAIPIVVAASLLKCGITENTPPSKLQSVQNIVHRYFYYTSFNQTFNEGGPGKMVSDYQLLNKWLSSGDPQYVPDIYTNGAPWIFDKMKEIKKNNSGAISKAIRCLYNSQSPKDLYTKRPVQVYDKDTELHHLFPVATYGDDVDSIFNLAFLKASTNNSIGSNTTKRYSEKILKTITEDQYKELLSTHLVKDDAYDAFMNEDYDKFIEERSDALIDVLEKKFDVRVTKLVSEPGDDYSDMYE